MHRSETKGTRIRNAAGAAALVLAVLFVHPRAALAQCEVGGAAAGAANGGANAGAISTATAALMGVYTATTAASQGLLTGLLEAMETAILNRMKQFWEDWEEALQDMTAQLHAGINDQTRQMSNLFDTSNLTSTARALQRQELNAKKKYAPTEQACRFDTAANYRASATRTGRAYQKVMAKEITDTITNNTDSPAAGGPREFAQERMQRHRTLFCDSTANGGQTDCPADLPDANAHITPSKTIFGDYTIDMTNPNNYLAVNELVMNLTEFKPLDPIAGESLGGSSAKEERQNRRSLIAQTDAVVGLVAGVIAERLPGEAATEISDSRLRMGIANPSDNPSQRELRQATIEQLWDPSYYVNLVDVTEAVSREETFLQAYNLMLLYKLIERTERIANVHALQTAHVLRNSDAVREGTPEDAPVQQ